MAELPKLIGNELFKKHVRVMKACAHWVKPRYEAIFGKVL